MAHVPAERCLSIIELLADGAREMPLGEIAEQLDLPKSGAHRLLATLVDLGWAEQDDGTSFYRLTMRLAVLGQRFYAASGLPDVCQPLLDRFAHDCREFARLAVVDGSSLVWIAHAQGATGGLLYQPKETTGGVPLFATASGKSWLATLDVNDAAQLVARNGGFSHADRYGPGVIRSIEALLKELRATARRGFGVAMNEAEPGVTAIAAAIRSQVDGSTVGTVSIAGPSARMTEDRVRELAPRVTQCATDLSRVWPVRAKSPTIAREPARRARPLAEGDPAKTAGKPA